MISKKNMSKNKSLADKIANLLVTAPSTVDPEDETVNDTKAKFTEPSDEFDEKEEELLSKFRKQNIDLLADVDNKYAGRKSSRKTLHESDESSEDELVNGSEADEEVDVNDASQLTESDESEERSADDDNDSDEYEDGSSNEEGDEGEENDEDDYDDNGDIFVNESTDSYKHLKETDVSAHVKKGMCVRNQLNIWENLLEMRIQLQKSVVAANRMPNFEKYTEIKKAAGPQFTNKVKETKKSVENLLNKLLLLQNLVLKKYPETRSLGKASINDEKLVTDDNEEIPSDTDVSEQSEIEDDDGQSPTKKRKLTDYENDICGNYKVYKNYRNEVIQKWHDKTRIVITKNNNSSHSIINHIEHTLSDREKLLRKTQLKKGDYVIVGEEEESKEDNEENTVKNFNEQYNSEIFDDNDFYHQQLRELIEVKSADLTDPVQLGRQWIQLQNLRSKMKRKIDTRATKGRKIRYAVHSKLVNFMAPFEENSWTDEAKTELYSSLFGKNK